TTGAVLLLATFVRAVAVNFRGVRDPLLVFATALAASQLLWFGLTSKVWIVVGYLILSIGLLSMLSFETLFVGFLAVVRIAKFPRRLSETKVAKFVRALAILLIIVECINNRWYTTARTVADINLGQHSTVRAANAWAIAEDIPAKSRIVFDDLAYFDRARFPNAKMHGGILTWPVVELVEPDYIVLSSTLFNAEWAQHLRQTQKANRFDLDPYSMRLYQDLLGSDQPGPTQVPGIILVHIIRPLLNQPLIDIPARVPLGNRKEIA